MQQTTPLYLAESIREMDRIAIEECHISGFELMQRAAQFAFTTLLSRWPKVSRLTILCGGGNNGGDGYVVAALAKQHNLHVDLIAVSDPARLTGDAQFAYQLSLTTKNVTLAFRESNWAKLLPDPAISSDIPSDDASLNFIEHVIVDAMLGTGLNKDVNGAYRDAIEQCNASQTPVIAMDLPSGLSADTGRAMGTAVHADCTVSFIGRKLGVMTGQGRAYAGQLYFSDLNVPPKALLSQTPCAQQLELNALITEVPKKVKHTHKGHYGHVLLIGGDKGFGGAILLAAEACARMGAGLTSVATQPEHCSALLSRCPEVMVKGLNSPDGLPPMLAKATVIVIGPGLGQSAWSQDMLKQVLTKQTPTIFDADALNLISSHPEWLPPDTRHGVFTPHPGEAARLLNTGTAAIENDRLSSVKQLQDKLGGSVILKGSGSLIACSQDDITLCPYGNPGMASGGMGDVLSGILGGLIAQEFPSALSAKLGVCLHAAAADMACEDQGERGLLAADLIPYARALLNKKRVLRS